MVIILNSYKFNNNKSFYVYIYNLLLVGKILLDAMEDSRLQEREISNLEKISHPFLPIFYGCFLHSGMRMIGIEYINGCTLSNYIKKGIELK